MDILHRKKQAAASQDMRIEGFPASKQNYRSCNHQIGTVYVFPLSMVLQNFPKHRVYTLLYRAHTLYKMYPVF